MISINELPDDVLLAIFVFYTEEEPRDKPISKKDAENSKHCCTPKTPARDLLDVWPALPLYIWGYNDCPTESMDNITAVLKHSDRVCQINLVGVPGSRLKNITAAMQFPFPELTHLILGSEDKMVPVLPDSFLGGSAPNLLALAFQGISFPGLPRLLLSATRLTVLRLDTIPHSEYFPPEAMVTALLSLIDLQCL